MAVLGVASFLGEINRDLGVCCVVVGQPNVFSMLLKKKYQKHSPFTMTLHHQNLALGLVNSSLCHNVDQRDLDRLDIPQNITLSLFFLY